MRKDYLWNTLGVLLQNAISPILLIVVTRVNGIYDSGIFSFAFSLSIVFWAIAMWGGRTYQVSDIKQQFSSRSYVMVRLILAVVVICGALVFSIVNSYDAVKIGLIMTLVVLKVIESVADSLYGVLQKHDKLYLTGRSLVYKAVVSFFMFSLLDVYTQNMIIGCVGVVAINLVILLLYDIPSVNKVENLVIKANDVGRLVRDAALIVKCCTPIFIMAFLAMLSLNTPRYFLDMHHQQEVGYFGIIAMPITLIILVMTFILQPNVIKLSKLNQEKAFGDFNRVVVKIILITAIIGLAALAAAYQYGVYVLAVVFAVDFTNYSQPLLIMMLGAIANAIIAILINAMVIIRRFKMQFYILLTTNLVLIIVSSGVVDKYGINGAAYLFTAANLIQLALLACGFVIIQRGNKSE